MRYGVYNLLALDIFKQTTNNIATQNIPILTMIIVSQPFRRTNAIAIINKRTNPCQKT